LFAGLLYKRQRKLSEIRFDGDKIYFIEYAFENNSYKEKETYEVYLKFDYAADSFQYAAYDGKALRGIKLPPDKTRYETFEEAEAANYR